MQAVAAGWTAEERDSVRSIAQNTQISWHKESTLGNRTFTIGVSTIGGNDAIGINPGAIGSPSNYRYFDESAYVTGLSWERGLSMPVGGLTKALAEVQLDNTSGRFTPNYMGGRSEIYTAILPMRPIIISAGFNFGVDQTLPQFTGLLSKQPKINMRSGEASLQAADYVNYFGGRYLDSTSVYTGETTDTIIGSIFAQQGMSTAQYDLDPGINVIPFAFFEKGQSITEVLDELVKSEFGHLYQDESGVFKFRNRYWGDSSPYNSVQRIVLTGQVLSAQAPSDDHIINVVEVTGKSMVKQPLRPLINFSTATPIPANSSVELFFDYGVPVLQLTPPTSSGSDSYYLANTQPDDSGTDVTSSVSVKSISNFSTTSKVTFQNNSASLVYLNHVVISGRSAQQVGDIYTRLQDDSSVTAFNEKPLAINNKYVQNSSWANSLAQLILSDFSEPESLQTIVIRAIPELQLFDMISWQGRYWRIFNIRTTLDPSAGFIQELTLLQRTIAQYFRIGISTIGSSDKIAP